MKKIIAFVLALCAMTFSQAATLSNLTDNENIKGSYQLQYLSSQGKKYAVWFPVFLDFGNQATFRLCTTYTGDYSYNDEILSADLNTKNTNWCNNIYRSSIQYSFTNEIKYNSKAWIDGDRLFVQTIKKIFVFKKI